MNTTTRTVPKLRFVEFNDEWQVKNRIMARCYNKNISKGARYAEDYGKFMVRWQRKGSG